MQNIIFCHMGAAATTGRRRCCDFFPLAVKNRICTQHSTICIAKCACIIRKPAFEAISLMGCLLCLCCIGCTGTDIIIRRWCHIRGVICANPLILNPDRWHIGHPVRLSCRFALPNNQALLHFPAWYENTVCIRLCRRSFAARNGCIPNKLCTDFRSFHRYIFTVDLNWFRSACTCIRRNHIDIAPFFCFPCAFF